MNLILLIISFVCLVTARRHGPKEVMSHGIGTYTLKAKTNDYEDMKTLIFMHGKGGSA